MDPDRGTPRRPWLAALADRSGGWFALALQSFLGAFGLALAAWSVADPGGYGPAALTGYAIGDLGAVLGFVVSQRHLDPGRRFPFLAFAFDMACLAGLVTFAWTAEVASIERHTNAILAGAGTGAVGFLGRFVALAWRTLVYHVYGRRLPSPGKEIPHDEPPAI